MFEFVNSRVSVSDGVHFLQLRVRVEHMLLRLESRFFGGDGDNSQPGRTVVRAYFNVGITVELTRDRLFSSGLKAQLPIENIDRAKRSDVRAHLGIYRRNIVDAALL